MQVICHSLPISFLVCSIKFKIISILFLCFLQSHYTCYGLGTSCCLENTLFNGCLNLNKFRMLIKEVAPAKIWFFLSEQLGKFECITSSILKDNESFSSHRPNRH